MQSTKALQTPKERVEAQISVLDKAVEAMTACVIDKPPKRRLA